MPSERFRLTIIIPKKGIYENTNVPLTPRHTPQNIFLKMTAENKAKLEEEVRIETALRLVPPPILSTDSMMMLGEKIKTLKIEAINIKKNNGIIKPNDKEKSQVSDQHLLLPPLPFLLPQLKKE